MALVALVRGINVGGHRTFRPSTIAEQLRHLDVVSVGAAGTFLVRRRVRPADLRAELARRLPFDAHVAICRAGDLVGLAARDFFAGRPAGPDVVPFVSVLCGTPRSAKAVPARLPSTGRWMVKILAIEGRFVVGIHRREMNAIGHLGALDRVFGVPLTTRSWSTLRAIARALEAPVRGLDAGAPHLAPVPDVIAPRLRILFVGINPSTYSAAVGRHFARPGNPFWRLLHAAGLTRRLLSPDEDRRLLELALGITNVCERPTRTAAELSRDELRDGARALHEKVAALEPRVVALVGITLYPVVLPGRAERGPGARRVRMSGARVFVLPNPSGLNAAFPGFESKLIWFRRLARWAGCRR